MNTTTDRKGHCGSLRAAIATTLAVLLTAWSANARAVQASPDAFQMMAIEDSAHGKLVTKGRYEEAIERIESRSSRSKAFAAQNNLCVAYAKTMALYKAVVACETALEARELRKPATHFHLPASRRILRDRAIALSNRGVLRFVMGDLDGAREDFEVAIALNSGLEEPEENLLRLETASVARR